MTYISSDINHLSLPDYRDSDILNSKICMRAKLDTGTFCNMHCSFCYYIDQLNIKTEFRKIIERVDYLVSMGVKEVDLSGGESSIHKDWFKILDYCNAKKLKISCLSNGWMFSDFKFIKRSKDLGLNEILFSLHGYNEVTHDLIVSKKGSFKKIIQAIKNAQDLNIKVRINCVVNEVNYSELSTKYTELINNIHPFELNFITINTWSNQKSFTDYKRFTESIKLCIPKIKDVLINVRYTPFCYMKGFENHVVDWYQHIFDIYDWNMNLYDYKAKTNNIEDMFSLAGKNRLKFYTKPRECMFCKYFKICDGIDHNIPVYPQKGKIINNVNHFRKNFYG